MRAAWTAFCLGTGLTLAGCDMPPPRDYMAEDSARCASFGFAVGSPAMAQCMQTLSMERQSVADREAWRDQARPAGWGYAPYAYDDGRRDDHKRDKDRNDRDKPKPDKKPDKKPAKKPDPPKKPQPAAKPPAAKPGAQPPKKPQKPLPPCLGIGVDPACAGASAS